MKKIFGLWLLSVLLLTLSSCAPSDLNTALTDVDQNVLPYLNPETEHTRLMSEEKQATLTQDYLTHYFSPWEDVELYPYLSRKTVQSTQHKAIKAYKESPGWGPHHQLNTVAFMQAIEDNMDLAHFPNLQQKAITVEPVHARLLPTFHPSFTSLKVAGEGFPFDNLQVSLLPANLPILVLHASQDKAWYLVVAHNIFGWVPATQVAQVNDAFIQQWRTGHYLTPVVLEAPIQDQAGRFHSYLRLGHFYPTTDQNNPEAYTILIARKNLDHQAVIQSISVPRRFMHPVPIPITPYQVALLANEILEQPYGWGGVFYYRDCSATIADLFAPFGIWLPRNSTDQLKTWKTISLRGLKKTEKRKVIKEKGIPMITTIGWPGHIMLYLGTHNQYIYVYHTIWGLKTTLLTGKTERAILGKTVITTLGLGSEYINIKATPLDKAQVLMFLGEKPSE